MAKLNINGGSNNQRKLRPSNNGNSGQLKLSNNRSASNQQGVKRPSQSSASQGKQLNLGGRNHQKKATPRRDTYYEQPEELELDIQDDELPEDDFYANEQNDEFDKEFSDNEFYSAHELEEEPTSQIPIAQTPTPTPSPKHAAPEPIVQEEHHEEPDHSNEDPKARKKRLAKEKREKQKKEREAKKKNKQPSIKYENLTVDEAYNLYQKKKIGVYILFILLVVGILGFGVYSTFFKHQLTPEEAFIFTNGANGQAINQKWDSGIQSYLQRNLETLFTKKFQSTGNASEFSLSNISVERNLPLDDYTFLTFFSFDLTANGKTERCYATLFISTNEDKKMNAISDVNITSRQPYSEYENQTGVVNQYMDFKEAGASIDDEETKAFKPVLENFLTLGYNSKQDISSIYKGESPLVFDGRFVSLDRVEVYDIPNKLGYNAVATYTLELTNGASISNTAYYSIEKVDDTTYYIKTVL